MGILTSANMEVKLKASQFVQAVFSIFSSIPLAANRFRILIAKRFKRSTPIDYFL